MARYLFIARYASEGAKGVLLKGGSARRTAVEKACTDLGGRVETFDFAFGDEDVYTIIDLPDNRAAAALAMTINSDGRAHVRTTVLLTPEEVDAASHVKVAYTPPGGK